MTDHYLLEVSEVSKRFGDAQVLCDVGLDLRAGEIHALIGHNGSGKSTLIKILAGFLRPDPGAQAWLDGEAFELGTRSPETKNRLHFIHQSLNLVPELNALDNIALGRGFATRFGLIDWRRHRRRAEEQVEALGLDFDVRTPVRELTAAERTILTIARAMTDWDAARSVLVLDEPTVSLPHTEVDALFETIRKVAAAGAGVLYVSHRLDEIFRLADRVTVLREGKVAAMGQPLAGLDEPQLVELMLGRAAAAMSTLARQKAPAPPAKSLADPLCTVRHLAGNTAKNVSFDVHEGEIVGIAGLDGSGREEIADLVFGSRTRGRGVITVKGTVVGTDPRSAIAAGMGLVPADRLGKAGIGAMRIVENVTLSSLRALTRLGIWIDRRRERSEVARLMDAVQLVPLDLDRDLGRLSGGNQQKVVIGKWLRLSPRLLILDEPVQGVDVGAKAAIFELITRCAHEGMAVLICSVATEDLEVICDRVCVMRGGSVVTEISGDALKSNAVAARVLSEIEAG
jgi:ribose transport system ATP-binding protein